MVDQVIELFEVDKLRELILHINSRFGSALSWISDLKKCSKLKMTHLRICSAGKNRLGDLSDGKTFGIRLQIPDELEVSSDATASASPTEQPCNLQMEVRASVPEDAADILELLSEAAGTLSHLRTLVLNVDVESGDRVPEALEKLLRSGNLPNLAELHIHDPGGLMTIAIDACFSGNTEKLEMILWGEMPDGAPGDKYRQRPLVREVEDAVLRWIQGLAVGHLPHLRYFPIAPSELWSDAVQKAILKAYKQNRYLCASLWEQQPEKHLSNEFLESFRDQLRSNEIRKESLQKLEKESLEPGSNGKVFLCGSPGVGKTTLRGALQKTWKDFFAGLPKRDSTRGIEVERMQLPKNNSDTQDLWLAIWDLAGQHEFEVLHSAFLPDVALGDGQATFFVIVCSASATKESNFASARDSLLYWLRFISSNSHRVVNEKLRRRVFVVLNCFFNDHSGHDAVIWRNTLALYQRQFKEALNLHPQPFIFNAKRNAEQFKTHICKEVRASLQRVLVHGICSEILANCQHWVTMNENKRYPILSWSMYRTCCCPRVSVEDALIEAATIYLHETGHIVLFKTLQTPKTSVQKYEISDQSVLVLDPQWLCERVIGHILLPEALLREGEKALVSTHQGPNGSVQLRLALVEREQFDVPKENCEQLFQILVRLGLGYTVFDNQENVFIPALIQDHSIPPWFCESGQNSTSHTFCSWVIGFSLMARDSLTTLLPVAVLHKLQVQLAQDDQIGCTSTSEFRAEVSRIWFKWETMGCLVEYHGDPKESHHNRLDVLVKPLVENDCKSHNEIRMERHKQVRLAKRIAWRASELASDCPGLDLLQAVVAPWSCGDGLIPLKERGGVCSVEEMLRNLRKKIETRADHFQDKDFWSTNWTVGRISVKYQDVLEEDNWRIIADEHEQKFDLTVSAVKQNFVSKQDEGGLAVTVLPDSKQCPPAISIPEQQVYGADLPLLREILEVAHTTLNEVRRMREDIQDMSDTMRKILEGQDTLDRQMQLLETYTINNQQNSVPRFVYITSREGTSRHWHQMKDLIEDAYSEEFFLHFWCEAGSNESKMHEVEGQPGIDLRELKAWAKKLAPVLDWSLKVAFVCAKVAGSAVLPGLGVLLPNLSDNLVSNGSMLTNGVSDLLKLCNDSRRGNLRELSKGRVNERELREAGRVAVKDLHGKLGPEEFEQKVMLKKVRIRDFDRRTKEIVWICYKCIASYGKRAEIM